MRRRMSGRRRNSQQNQSCVNGSVFVFFVCLCVWTSVRYLCRTAFLYLFFIHFVFIEFSMNQMSLSVRDGDGKCRDIQIVNWASLRNG